MDEKLLHDVLYEMYAFEFGGKKYESFKLGVKNMALIAAWKNSTKEADRRKYMEQIAREYEVKHGKDNI